MALVIVEEAVAIYVANVSLSEESAVNAGLALFALVAGINIPVPLVLKLFDVLKVTVCTYACSGTCCYAALMSGSLGEQTCTLATDLVGYAVVSAGRIYALFTLYVMLRVDRTGSIVSAICAIEGVIVITCCELAVFLVTLGTYSLIRARSSAAVASVSEEVWLTVAVLVIGSIAIFANVTGKCNVSVIGTGCIGVYLAAEFLIRVTLEENCLGVGILTTVALVGCGTVHRTGSGVLDLYVVVSESRHYLLLAVYNATLGTALAFGKTAVGTCGLNGKIDVVFVTES